MNAVAGGSVGIKNVVVCFANQSVIKSVIEIASN